MVMLVLIRDIKGKENINWQDIKVQQLHQNKNLEIKIIIQKTHINMHIADKCTKFSGYS